MGCEPARCGVRGAFHQHVDNGTPFEIDQDRPVVAALTPGTIVDPNNPRRHLGPRSSHVRFQGSQQRVIALRQPKTYHQPLRWPASNSVGEEASQVDDPAGPPSKKLRDIR